MEPLPLAALVVVGALNLVAFALCLLDKSRARRGARRVRERTLLGVALAGGSPGLVLGMLVARHKTRKGSFLAPLALILVGQAALLWLALDRGVL